MVCNIKYIFIYNINEIKLIKTHNYSIIIIEINNI